MLLMSSILAGQYGLRYYGSVWAEQLVETCWECEEDWEGETLMKPRRGSKRYLSGGRLDERTKRKTTGEEECGLDMNIDSLLPTVTLMKPSGSGHEEDFKATALGYLKSFRKADNWPLPGGSFEDGCVCTTPRRPIPDIIGVTPSRTEENPPPAVRGFTRNQPSPQLHDFDIYKI